LKQTPQGVSVCRFNIAVNRRVKKADGTTDVDFFTIVAWRHTADFVSRYFTKGRPILVCGSIQNRSWTDQNGQKRYATEIVADEAYFVDAKSESPAQQSAPAQGTYIPEAYTQPIPQGAPNMQVLSADDELPF
jgi:single-strand DNA-binding protein